MPVQIQMQGMTIEHLEMAVPLRDGTEGKRHALLMHCPVTGLVVQAIFDESEMEVTENGDLLLKRQPDVDLTVADATDLQKLDRAAKSGTKKGPPRRPPQAGQGRPGR